MLNKLLSILNHVKRTNRLIKDDDLQFFTGFMLGILFIGLIIIIGIIMWCK